MGTTCRVAAIGIIFQSRLLIALLCREGRYGFYTEGMEIAAEGRCCTGWYHAGIQACSNRGVRYAGLVAKIDYSDSGLPMVEVS